jgi:hypothetical protein
LWISLGGRQTSGFRLFWTPNLSRDLLGRTGAPGGCLGGPISTSTQSLVDWLGRRHGLCILDLKDGEDNPPPPPTPLFMDDVGVRGPLLAGLQCCLAVALENPFDF